VFQIGKDIMLTNSTGSLLSVSTVLSDVASASASASSALSGLSAKLDNNAATVMSSNFYLKTSGFDAGNGVAIYGSGIVAKKNNVNTFVLNASGDAVFAGDISAATGTFAGNISSAGFISVTGGSLTSASGVQGTFHTALLATANVAGAAGVVGQCATGLAGGFGVVGLASSLGGSHGVYGEATGNNSTGVYGATNHAGSRGVTAVNTAPGGVALRVQGRMTIDNSTLVTNLNADRLDGYDAGNNSGNVPISNGVKNTNLVAAKLAAAETANSYELDGGAVTGASTATFTGTKPGNAESNGWLKIIIDGSTYWIPIWPN
jgi:hypothetical protein